MTDQTTEQARYHHYLVAGNVVFADDQGNIQAIPQNAMLVTESQNLGVQQIGKAQQALQMTFTQKLGQPVKIVEVLIFGLAYLGHMTEAEFHNHPEDVVLQERDKPSADIIDLSKEIKDRG